VSLESDSAECGEICSFAQPHAQAAGHAATALGHGTDEAPHAATTGHSLKDVKNLLGWHYTIASTQEID
jgi:hypothetical protein